jgi:Protein of unknown function (DUF3168)
MQDATLALQTSVVAYLIPRLPGVTVANYVRSGDEPPFVLVQKDNVQEWSTKDTCGQKHTLEIEVFAVGRGAKNVREITATLIESLSNHRPVVAGHYASVFKFDGADDEPLSDNLNYRAAVRFVIYTQPVY